MSDSATFPNLIIQQATADQLFEILAKEPRLAIDSESNSLYAYREKVCLIQISTPSADYILDPLSGIRLDALGEILRNPAIEKIFHAAEYDLLGFQRDYGWTACNIFDTMLAVRALGWEQTGLAYALEKFYGLQLVKKYQRADWGQRPLSPEMLEYASSDTHYLFALRNELASQLQSLDRWAETCEEFARLARNCALPRDNKFDENGYWNISGARRLETSQITALQALWQSRDLQAQERDLPAFKILRDEELLCIARELPASAEELLTLVGLTHTQIAQHSSWILPTLQLASQLPPPQEPSISGPSEEVRTRYELLRQWRKERALQRGVASDIILSREALWELAHANPQSTTELEGLKHLGNWRRAQYGAELLQLLAHKEA